MRGGRNVNGRSLDSMANNLLIPWPRKDR